MIKRINKKGQLTQNKVITTIIVILVIASVLIFVFKADILKYLRNISGYESTQQDEELDLSELGDEEAKTLCPFRIGGIGSDDLIFFCKDFDIACKNKIASKIQIEGDLIEADLEIVKPWYQFDSEIGFVSNKRFTIFNEILEKRSLYEELKDDLPDFKFIKNLNGAKYFSGNLICRDSIV